MISQAHTSECSKQWLLFKVVIWLRAGGVCCVALVCLFGVGLLTLASFDNVKVLAAFRSNYLFFAFNVMASGILGLNIVC